MKSPTLKCGGFLVNLIVILVIVLSYVERHYSRMGTARNIGGTA
jgi:hypothetical protein